MIFGTITLLSSPWFPLCCVDLFVLCLSTSLIKMTQIDTSNTAEEDIPHLYPLSATIWHLFVDKVPLWELSFFLPSSNWLTLYYSMSSHFILTLNRSLQKDYVIPRKFGGPWTGCRRFLWIWYLWQFFSVCIHTKLILRIIVKTYVSIICVMHGKLRWSKIRWKQGKREKRVLLFFIPVKWVS